MFFSIYNSIGALSSSYYSSGAYVAYGVLQMIVNIAKIVVYVVFALLSFFNVKVVSDKSEEKAEDKPEEKKEEKSSDNNI